MLALLLVIILVGVLLYFVNTTIPMDAKVKQILNVVVVIVLVCYVLNAFGVFAYLAHHDTMPRI
jgi:uncharacterized membrane protein YesL